MGSRRRTGFGAMTLLIASLAACPAGALPITFYADVDFGADHVAARERIGGSSGSAAAAAPVEFALRPRQAALATTPVEISFRRWDESEPEALDAAALALVAPGR